MKARVLFYYYAFGGMNMSKENKMTVCSHCGAEIASSAKVCPKCGGKNKKPIYKRPWFIILVIIILLGIIGSAMGGSDKGNASSSKTAGAVSTASETETDSQSSTEEKEPEITYTAYTVSELMADLENNALGAAEKYKNQYVELTGKLDNIDSAGKYINITAGDSDFEIIGVTCYIKSDDQKKVIMSASKGDTMVIKGKIIDVGEVFGYYLDIDEISTAQ